MVSPTDPPPPPPVPQDFATAHPKADAGLKLLISERAQLEAMLLQFDALATLVQQQRSAAQKLHDDVVNLLDRGPWA